MTLRLDLRLLVALPLVALPLAGCPAPECARTVACVVACTDAIPTVACGSCPAGTIDRATCAPFDAGTDAPELDAPIADEDGGEPLDAETADVPGLDAPASDAPTADAPVARSNQVISRDCGPADGPALRIGIHQAAGPGCDADPEQGSLDLWLYEFDAFPPTAGSTVRSTAGMPAGVITECPGGAPPCRTSSAFTVDFDTFTDEVGATGSYSVTWGPSDTDTGTFDAMWCEDGPVICG